MVPNFENGQPSGYKKYQVVEDTGVHQKLSLQEGETISAPIAIPAGEEKPLE
jgi:hypothetical protein